MQIAGPDQRTAIFGLRCARAAQELLTEINFSTKNWMTTKDSGGARDATACGFELYLSATEFSIREESYP
jgi:hypothetical protein